MIPLKDNIPTRTTPVVNYVILTACGIVWLLQLASGGGRSQLVYEYGMVPVRVAHPNERIIVRQEQIQRTFFGPRRVVVPREFPPAGVHPYWTLLTCIFLHGSWMHFLGNMLFLYIFGDNVEDRLGHVGYVVFYLLAGMTASASHFLTEIHSLIPTIGASGAIAGVMGAYFVLYPRAQVLTLIPIFIIFEIVVLPAWIFLGLWFLFQLWQGSLVSASTGVAWWAHIGGFAAGAGVVYGLRRLGFLRPPPARFLPYSRGFSHTRIRRG